MTSGVFSCADIASVPGAVAVDLPVHVKELCELDAELGDGDLRVTVKLAAEAMAHIPDCERDSDVGLLLSTLGMEVNRGSPSTCGTPLAAAFLAAASSASGKTAVGPKDLVRMGHGAIEGIKKMGKADLYGKSMLDSLVPADEAFDYALKQHKHAQSTSAWAVTVAAVRLKATRTVTARHGRARWRGQNSASAQDAGATALYYLIHSFARHAGCRLGRRRLQMAGARRESGGWSDQSTSPRDASGRIRTSQ